MRYAKCTPALKLIVSLMGLRLVSSLVLGCGSPGCGLEGVLGLLLDESDEALERAVTIVVDELARAGRLELESWEAGDTEGNGCGEVILLCLDLRAVNTS